MAAVRIRRMCGLSALAALVVAAPVVAAPVVAAASPSARCAAVVWSPAQTRQVSHAVVDVVIEDPAVTQRVLARTGSPAFVRQSWRLRVRSVAWRAQAPVRDPGAKAAIAALAADASLLVDEADWRGALAHHRRCQTGRCPERCAPAMLTSLSREPVAGAVVRAYLRWTRDGWALSADRAFDAVDGGGPR